MKTTIILFVCIVATATASPQFFQNPSPGFAPTRLFVDFANGLITPFSSLTSSFMQSGQATADAVDRTVFNNGLLNRLGAFNPISSVSAATNNFIRQSNNGASQLLQPGQDLASNAFTGAANAASSISQIPQAAANAVQQTANGIGVTGSNTPVNNNVTQAPPTPGASSNANSATTVQ